MPAGGALRLPIWVTAGTRCKPDFRALNRKKHISNSRLRPFNRLLLDFRGDLHYTGGNERAWFYETEIMEQGFYIAAAGQCGQHPGRFDVRCSHRLLGL